MGDALAERHFTSVLYGLIHDEDYAEAIRILQVRNK